MANYLITDVLDDVAEWLGDPTKDRFDAAACLPGYRSAWGDMVRLMRKWKLPEVERDLFTAVSPYTGSLRPAALAPDFSVPMDIWERGTPTSVIITSVSAGTPILVTTSTPHGRATNDSVQLTGVDVSVDGEYYVTVTGASTFTLNGTVGAAAFTTGTVIYSNDEFVAVNQVLDFAPVNTGNALATIGAWHWRNNIIFLKPCVSSRELLIHFRTSGAPPMPSSTPVYLGFDDARDFLSHAAASYAAGSNDMPGVADREREIAYGPTGQADGRGGILRDLMMPLLTAKQSVPKRPQPFRPRKSDPARASIL